MTLIKEADLEFVQAKRFNVHKQKFDTILNDLDIKLIELAVTLKLPFRRLKGALAEIPRENLNIYQCEAIYKFFRKSSPNNAVKFNDLFFASEDKTAMVLNVNRDFWETHIKKLDIAFYGLKHRHPEIVKTFVKLKKQLNIVVNKSTDILVDREVKK